MDEVAAKLAALPRWKDRFVSGQICTVEEIESFSVARMKDDNAITGTQRIPEVPFGFQNQAWERLKAQIQPGDVLMFYRSDQESWAKQAGREGFRLMRGGAGVGGITTSMS